MRSLSAAAPKATRPIAEGRSPRRRAAQFRLERLEGRDLQAPIAGVSVQYGTMFVQPQKFAGNNLNLTRINSNTVRLTYNGQSNDYYGINGFSYKTGQGGYDTVVNNTDLGTTVYAYGGRNQITGSTSLTVAYLYKNNNTFTARGRSYVYSYDGPQDRINPTYNTYVYRYNTAQSFSKYY